MQMEVLFGTHLKIGASCLGLALVEGPPDLRAVISNIWWLCRARRGSWGEGCSWGPAGAYLLSFSLWGGWGPEGHNSRAVALNGSKMTYQKKKKKGNTQATVLKHLQGRHYAKCYKGGDLLSENSPPRRGRGWSDSSHIQEDIYYTQECLQKLSISSVPLGFCACARPVYSREWEKAVYPWKGTKTLFTVLAVSFLFKRDPCAKLYI